VSANAGNIRHIYHFMMTLKDSSIDADSKGLQVYVLTNEGGEHLFDLWEQLPRAEDYEAWQKLPKESIKNFEKKMEGLKKSDVPMKMVIQLLITEKGKPFFKLYDTVFLP
jgi:hypothetical protein